MVIANLSMWFRRSTCLEILSFAAMDRSSWPHAAGHTSRAIASLAENWCGNWWSRKLITIEITKKNMETLKRSCRSKGEDKYLFLFDTIEWCWMYLRETVRRRSEKTASAGVIWVNRWCFLWKLSARTDWWNWSQDLAFPEYGISLFVECVQTQRKSWDWSSPWCYDPCGRITGFSFGRGASLVIAYNNTLKMGKKAVIYQPINSATVMAGNFQLEYQHGVPSFNHWPEILEKNSWKSNLIDDIIWTYRCEFPLGFQGGQPP